MILLGKIEDFQKQTVTQIRAKQLDLLIIHHQAQWFLIENKCGHFGLALEEGAVQDMNIVCPHHGISFSLQTGEVVNRPYENCDAIKLYPIVEQGGLLYLDE